MIIQNKDHRDKIIEFVRLDLYNKAIPCGANAIINKMKEMEIMPMPSLSTINRVLRERYLTHGRQGYYPGEPYI
jgi:hypothetical protein